MSWKEFKYWFVNIYGEDRYDNTGCCGPTLAFCFIAAIILLSSCKSVQYVPVETTHVEHYHHTDTVKERDSVIVEKTTTIKEADNEILAKYGLQLKNNEKAILILSNEFQKLVSEKQESKIDTIIKVDSIQVPYPIEKKLSKWEQVKMDLGGIAFGGCLLAVALMICFFIRKYKKNFVV